MSTTMAYIVLGLVAIDVIVSGLIWIFIDRSEYRGDGDFAAVIKGIFVFNAFYGFCIVAVAVMYSLYLLW